MAKVKIDGKEYDTDKLSADANTQLNNLRGCEARLQELQRDIAITNAARKTYAQLLNEALPKDA